MTQLTDELISYLCPCLIADEPCHEECTCVHTFSSAGCRCCATYGSDEQRKLAAARLVERSHQPTLTHLIDGLRLECQESPVAEYERAVTPFGTYYFYDHQWTDVDDNDHPCECRAQGKERGIADYKQRVRAIFEGGV